MTTDTDCRHEWEDVTQIADPMPYRLVCIHCHALMEPAPGEWIEDET